jgi:hypothetical protein
VGGSAESVGSAPPSFSVSGVNSGSIFTLLSMPDISWLLRQFPITTRTGARPTWCIGRCGIGFWLGSIQVASVRAEVRPRLLDFQEALVDAADRLLFGELGITAEVNTLSGATRSR